jgi:hypothetical protein
MSKIIKEEGDSSDDVVSEASVDLDSGESYDDQAVEDELEILTNEQHDFYMK